MYDNLNLKLLEEIKEPDLYARKVHSFYVNDTNNDGSDEVFIGIDSEGFYHLDINNNKKMFKMYDYSENNAGIGAIEEN